MQHDNTNVIQKEWEMERKRILFVCTYNGARAQIAEEFAKLSASGKIEVQTSCFELEKIGPLPIAVMREIGIDTENA